VRLIRSTEHSPAQNLALEEFLYRNRPDGVTLLLYRNAPSVVCGRNQNPWQEADTLWCRENGIPVLRRLSGGGTVYHDLGNVNYAFFVPRADYDPDRFVGVAVEALRSLGVEADIQGQHSIWAAGRKLSGSAFALNGKCAMLHGCILAETQLEQLSRSLRKRPDISYEGSSVASVPAPVTNAIALSPMATADAVEQALIATAEQFFGEAESCSLDADLTALSAKYASPEWTWEHTSPFKATRALPDGSRIFLEVNTGRVAQTYSLYDESMLH
jgi:lipoate-protein ligase A